ncbi:Glutamate receptor ionotropic, delta-1 [Amphibalanus amphitrite]|uniref:Glutamate receptor ionotropic, delta-1 n=1 Tax=Amphibalanus amphitrite TaxID=1232801 RepID=A0A6A4VDK3_AMPAM|nr:Glutamate receptor ionotropic, delta-1 [Amphibalanus amphitrite]
MCCRGVAVAQPSAADLAWTSSLSELTSHLTAAGELPAATLHVLPCGAVSERALTGLLRRLACRRGCTVAELCRPCHQQLGAGLYRPSGGTLLLWAGSADCLQPPEESAPRHWASATTNILSTLGRHLNFSTELRHHPRRVWAHHENGTWHGLLASVVRAEADLALGGISVTAERAGAVHFLQEFTIVRSMFVSRRPPPLPAYLTVLAPFTPSLWATVIGTLLAVSLTLMVLRKCSFHQALSDTYKILLAQSLPRTFLTFPVMLLIGVWLLTAFTIGCSYISSLTSFLVNGAPGRPVETTEQLADSDYQLVVSHTNGLFTEWLNTRQGAVFSRLREKVVMETQFMNSLSSLTAYNRAHVIEDAYFEYALSWIALNTNGSLWREDLVPSRDRFMPTSLAIPVQRNAPYRHALSHAILRLSAAGLVQKWLEDALYGIHLQAIRANIEACKVSQENCRDKNRARQIGLKHMEGPFLLLLTGYAVAIVVFVIETQMGRWRRLGLSQRKT